MSNDDKAALVVRAECILAYCCPRYHLEELRDLLRQVIAGLPPEAADAALVQLFADVEVCHEVLREEHGLRSGETPF